MPAARTLTLFLLLALAAPLARAQTSTLDPEAVKSSLEQFLSIATFGTRSGTRPGGRGYPERRKLSGAAAPRRVLGACRRRRQCGRPSDRSGVAGRHVNDVPVSWDSGNGPGKRLACADRLFNRSPGDHREGRSRPDDAIILCGGLQGHPAVVRTGRTARRTDNRSLQHQWHGFCQFRWPADTCLARQWHRPSLHRTRPERLCL